MNVRPVVGLAGVLCLVVILVSILGLLSVVPFSGTVIFGEILMLAIAMVLAGYPATA